MTRNVAYLLRGILSFALAISLASAFAPFALAVDGAEIDRQVAEKQAEANAHQQVVDEQQMTAYELSQQIEERQAAFSAARAEADEAQASIEANEARIAELEREIPVQEERSNAAAREMYKFQQDSLSIINVLLGAQNLADFISQVEYMNRVSQAQIDEVQRLADMKAEVNDAQTKMKSLKSEAEMRAEEARVALVAAQDAQAQVQARIAEEARLIAEITAMAEELAAQPRDNDKGSIASVGDAGAAAPAPAPSAAEASAAPEANAGSAGGESAPEAAPAAPSTPDMSSGESAFVSEWAARIDAYLSGSPLAGQGTTFARAAYQYGVDPRLSPAISFTESGKGAVCFLPHNAWGWGSVSWGSWEEAIFDHVAGLSRGYGGQLTVEGAQKYCPPNWQLWYDRTLGQMQLI